MPDFVIEVPSLGNTRAEMTRNIRRLARPDAAADVAAAIKDQLCSGMTSRLAA